MSDYGCVVYGVPRGSKAPIRVDPYFKNTGRPVKIRVDPYFRYGSTRIFAGRPVRPVFYGSTCIYGSTRNIRVDPYFTGRPVSLIRVDPYFCGSTRIFAGRPVFLRVDPYFKNTGRPVKYGSTCNLRVDPYHTGRPVFSLK